jgi:iron(III) transport system substrate-binding protein
MAAVHKVAALAVAAFWSVASFGDDAAAAAPSLTLLCSVQIEWCRVLQTVYTFRSGTEVKLIHKGSGEALALLAAEKAQPTIDLWFGGTGDPHLQAAEQGLTLEHRSPRLAFLHTWARQQSELSQGRSVGIYAGPLGFAYNTQRLAALNLAPPRSWKDLLRPEYKGEIQVAHPASSGTAYLMVATLVQLMGEDAAFEYMKQLHRNVSQYPRAGTAPLKAVARGEVAVSISFVHDGPGERMLGAPVATVTPAEGTGAEIGSMSLVKGARHPQAARDFYEWALTGPVQQLAAASRQFQLPSSQDIPSVSPNTPDFRKINFIKYDYARYGASAERKRLIARWEKEVNPAVAP